MSDTYQLQYPKDKCYICGKTESDLQFLREDAISNYELRVKKSEESIKKRKEIIDFIFSHRYPTDVLEFRVHTILSDLSKFTNQIPYVNILLHFKTNREIIQDRKINELTLDDIRTGLERNPELFWDHPEMGSAKSEYERNTKELEAIRSSKKMALNLKEKRIDMDGLPHLTTLSVHICPICDALFRETSIGAYRKRMHDED